MVKLSKHEVELTMSKKLGQQDQPVQSYRDMKERSYLRSNTCFTLTRVWSVWSRERRVCEDDQKQEDR